MFVGGIFALVLLSRLLLSRFIMWTVVILLPVWWIASATLPPDRAFDAKKELKRVLRGEHLQADHPEKPKSWLAKTAYRVAASIGVEVASVGGYTQEIVYIANIAKIAIVTMDMTKQRFYWVGAFHKFHYFGCREQEQQ